MQALNDITRVGIHSNHAHNLLTHANAQVTLHHSNEFSKEYNLVVVTFFHIICLESGFDCLHPVHEVNQKRDLGGIIFEPVFLGFFGESLERVSGDGLDGETHSVDDVLQIVFDFALKFQRLREVNRFLTNRCMDLGGVWTLLSAVLKFKSINGLENLRHVDHDFTRVVTV